MAKKCYLLGILLILAGFLAATFYLVWFFNSLEEGEARTSVGQLIINSDLLAAVSITQFLGFGLLIVGFIMGRKSKRNRSSLGSIHGPALSSVRPASSATEI